MDYVQLFIVAILVEAIWTNIKMIYDKNKISISMIGSLVIAILLCTLTQVDIFSVIGLPISIPLIGSILTGIIVSRGANVLNDVIKKIGKLKESE